MKKVMALMLMCLFLVSCASPQVINGKRYEPYEPYGLFNEDDVKKDNIKYEVSMGSVIVGVIFSETLIVPLYVFGWDLFEAKHEK